MQNEINNVLGAVLVYSRSASGHSGRIDGDDTSQSGSQVLDGPGAQSSGIGAPDDDDGDGAPPLPLICPGPCALRVSALAHLRCHERRVGKSENMAASCSVLPVRPSSR